TLVDILDGLGTNLKDFFNDEDNEKVVFLKGDFFETENEEYKYTLKWIVPNAQKNIMEPIFIEIDSNGRSKEDTHHEGEEFGYVILGSIILCLGSKRYKVKKGESFYFKANVNHYIINPGKGIARILWVSSPPNF